MPKNTSEIGRRIISLEGAMVATGMVSLATTWRAHLGIHTPIHYELAAIGLGVESLTIGAGLASIATKESHPEVSRVLSRIALAGLILTAACYTAVVFTDPMYLSFFAERWPFGLEDAPEFTNILVKDVARLSGLQDLFPNLAK